ncbi:collagenase-like PrtC family protease [Breoghania corrubedonensis]|uniref:Ubiquinone biosynthesis protein UbiV n=1 Tax=Breoghania corrubedonensis TaxID=665038 RepID=A0A2T5VB76_9HYPH|nr:U32 family peptidase [Breoghania corrubedonensis]PTW61006.1 collagenase-like PrtC family protease [Breoghania corrubedonensis]
MDRPENHIGLTLGPVLFNWSAERLRDFYATIADRSAFDRVHVGEVVCGKRMPFSDPVWPDIIAMLEDAGKEVVVSALALPATVRERKTIAALCEDDDRLVEINDVTALSQRGGKPFVVGPFVNVYNEGTVRLMASRGARTVCVPVELPLASLTSMAQSCPDIEFEVFAFGRLPLALSGRCYHARLHGLHKDSCRFICDQDPDGLDVETMDGQPFLAANGIQTLSHGVQAFCPAPEEAARAGVRRLRLSPHTVNMVAAGDTYRSLLDGRIEPAEALNRLRGLNLPGELVDGYERGLAGCLAAGQA